MTSGEVVSILTSIFLLICGGGALIFPRTFVQMVAGGGLSVGAALATARNGGMIPALGVLLAGLAATAVVGSIPRGTNNNDPIGLPFRLLLTIFAALSTVVLATGNPLGSAGAFDLNIGWYWAALIGTVLLIGERRSSYVAMGTALLAGAIGLVNIHVSGTVSPPVAIVLAAAPVSLATAVRWIDRST